MKQIFFKLSVCTYSACFIISKCITCIYFSHKDDESYQEKTNNNNNKTTNLLFCRSLKPSKLAVGFFGMTMFLEGAAYKITWIICKLCKTYAFLKISLWGRETVFVPSIMISTWKHFKALDFKIMFFENSNVYGFLKYFMDLFSPRKLFLWKKIAFVCRTRTFCTTVML